MYKINIKTPAQVAIMREGGKILGKILKDLKGLCLDNVDVYDIETAFLNMCLANNAEPSCKGFMSGDSEPFPTGLCLGINDQAVHNYPKKGTKFKAGDLVVIDTIIKYKGLYVDAAVSFGIGNLPANKRKFLETTEEALLSTIKLVKPGIRTGVLSFNLEQFARKNGYSVLKDYSGHGIGLEMHEPPEILCYGKESSGDKLLENMTIAIEPLYCEGKNKLKYKGEWETKTVDGKCFCQSEHTVLVTSSGYEVLTNGN